MKNYLLSYHIKYENIEPTEVSDNIYIGSYRNIDDSYDKIISLVEVECDERQFKYIIKDTPFYKMNVSFNEQELIKEFVEHIPRLNEIYLFIEQNCGKKILIHCHKGISRSAFVYLFYKLKKSYSKYKHKTPILLALVIKLMSKRPYISIGDKFIYYLCIVEQCIITNQ